MRATDERCVFCAAWRRAASRAEALVLDAVSTAVFVPPFLVTGVGALVVDVATPLLACSGLLSTSTSFSVEAWRTSSMLFCVFGLLRCAVLRVFAVFLAILTYSLPGRLQKYQASRAYSFIWYFLTTPI